MKSLAVIISEMRPSTFCAPYTKDRTLKSDQSLNLGFYKSQIKFILPYYVKLRQKILVFFT